MCETTDSMGSQDVTQDWVICKRFSKWSYIWPCKPLCALETLKTSYKSLILVISIPHHRGHCNWKHDLQQAAESGTHSEKEPGFCGYTPPLALYGPHC